jgi:hypothetical protein
MKGYLVEIPEREREAVRRLLELPGIAWQFFDSHGLNPSLSWCIQRVRHDRLVESFKGDVDILMGRLDLNESGGIKWPPSTDYLVGIEAKCAYLHPDANEITEDAIKSKKSSEQEIRKTQRQVKELLQMGFDKVTLLDMIANPPAFGIDSRAWFVALETAETSMKEMLPTLQKRLPDNSPAGHWVWSIGSVIGGDETMRGAGAPIELRRACENPFLRKDSKTRSRRQEMQHNLHGILARLPPPCRLPAVFIDCGACTKVHRTGNVCKID